MKSLLLKVGLTIQNHITDHIHQKTFVFILASIIICCSWMNKVQLGTIFVVHVAKSEMMEHKPLLKQMDLLIALLKGFITNEGVAVTPAPGLELIICVRRTTHLAISADNMWWCRRACVQCVLGGTQYYAYIFLHAYFKYKVFEIKIYLCIFLLGITFDTGHERTIRLCIRIRGRLHRQQSRHSAIYAR